MHVISRKPLKEAAEKDPDLAVPQDVWYRTASKAEWKSLVDVRQTYPQADYVDPYTIFNIKGNSYRLIVKIQYQSSLVFIKHVLAHAEYDKGGWKK